VSFILPRQVVKPLLELKKSIDHAAAGNFEIEFDVQGKGEIVELAASLRNMFASVSKGTVDGEAENISVPRQRS
jgi:methyl-accepting chemotaxis protein